MTVVAGCLCDKLWWNSLGATQRAPGCSFSEWSLMLWCTIWWYRFAFDSPMLLWVATINLMTQQTIFVCDCPFGGLSIPYLGWTNICSCTSRKRYSTVHFYHQNEWLGLWLDALELQNVEWISEELTCLTLIWFYFLRKKITTFEFLLKRELAKHSKQTRQR